MKFSILIPVYNEKATILELLRRVEAVDLSMFNCDKEIILIDDFSTDGTREILMNLKDKYKIFYHDKNYGKGRAIRTGIAAVTGDIVIIQDADLEYDPNDYSTILKCAIDNNADVVYGSRRLKKENNQYSGISYYFGGIAVTIITNVLYGINITDEPTCYKMFRADLIKSIPLKCNQFEFCPEVTAKIAKKKIKIYEVPISYFPRHVNEGKKIKWTDGMQAVWVLMKYKFFD